MGDIKVFLVSNSPRRKLIFELICKKFSVLKPENVDEKKYHNEVPEKTVVENAVRKVLSAYDKNKKGIYISADTEVFFKGKVYGKPKSYDDAFFMLKSLRGQKHTVVTGVCIIDNMFHNEKIEFSDVSYVEFKMLNDEQIKSYILKNNVMDKAGAYAVQCDKEGIVKSVDGSVWNVVGFPLEKFYKVIKEKEYKILFDKIIFYLNMDMTNICRLMLKKS